MDNPSIELPNNKCPKCGQLIDLATGVDKDFKQVKEKDFFICISCGEIFRVDSNLRSQLCTGIDLKELRDNNPKGYRKIIQARAFIKHNRRTGKWK